MYIVDAENVFLAFYIGMWSFLFTNHLVNKKEIFGFISKAINEYVTGEKDRIPAVDDLRAFDYALWKWTNCEKCHAGLIGLVYALVFMFKATVIKSQSLLPVALQMFFFICLCMFFALLMSRLIKRN